MIIIVMLSTVLWTWFRNFLHRNNKPFSGIEARTMKGMVQQIDLNQKLSNYNELLAEVDEIYVKHATAFHLPQYVAHLNCPVVIPALAGRNPCKCYQFFSGYL